MFRTALLGLALFLAFAAPAPAIVGGEPAREEYPFFAQLLDGGDYLCGASLVRERWLLTAAHCVVGGDPAQFTAILGSHDRTVGTPIGVVSLKVHPGFQQESLPVLKAAWDVAVVELERAPDVPVLPLAEPAHFGPGTPAVAIGFGADGFAIGSYRERLHEATLPIVDDAECGRVYAGRFDARQHICAGTLENESNTCQGDSGGPLIVRDAQGRWRLVGTTSFGIGCGTPGTYNVFARAAGPELRGWIDQQLPPPAPAPVVPASPPPAAPPPAAVAPSAPAASRDKPSTACRRARSAVRSSARKLRGARGRSARARAQRRLSRARRTARLRCSA